MSDLINSVKRVGLQIADHLAPVLVESKFKEEAVLTPDEFVVAGDHLVFKCPTWQWGRCDPSKVREFMPADKQFLVTKGVPCLQRIKDALYNDKLEKIIDDEAGDQWVDTHHFAAPSTSASKPVEVEQDDDEEEDPIDLDEFEAEGKTVTLIANSASGNESAEKVEARTYDLYITYDKYYRTPRLWLSGYNEQNKPLTEQELYDDISQNHAKKTITMEVHPHLPGNELMASVHPCKHADVMKRIMQSMSEGGKTMQLEQYLILFLKFVQAVIPTIAYDNTQDVSL